MQFSIPAASSSKRTRDNTNFVRPTPPTTPQPRRYYSIRPSTRSHNKQSPVLTRQETAPLPESTCHTMNSPHHTAYLRRRHTAPEDESAKEHTRHSRQKSKVKIWTHDNWKNLSCYYEAVGRNIDKAVKTFYRHESVQLHEDDHGNYSITELWPKDFIKRRVICLSIATKMHNGVPLLERVRAYNERKRRRHDEDGTIDNEHINFKKARRQANK